MTATRHDDSSSDALAGLVVADLSTTLPGAFATQFLADAGADVVMIEPPGGSPLRGMTAWPALSRGKRSTRLDLHETMGRATLQEMISGADVTVTTMRPAAAERLGLDPDTLARTNPRLVSAAITGWGSTGPWRDMKGYEALVLAKIGVLHAKHRATPRPGPAFVATPYASWGAAQTALHGILAALYERESSGRGQHVDADLLRGVATMDTYNWFYELVNERWPGAYQAVAGFDEGGLPRSPLIYPLLVAPTKDGYWLQFAQTEPRLFRAMLEEMGLGNLFADPAWAGLPVLETQEKRTLLWEMMIGKVGERTLAEWQRTFEANPNVMAEVYSTPAQALGHPQLRHDGRVATLDDPILGPVTQPSTLVHADGAPLSPPRRAPRLGEHDTAPPPRAGHAAPSEATFVDVGLDLPLKGVTVLELGSMFAAPYGATLLTDLGARVVKVEPLAGDTIRGLIQFPEAGGAKVLQGKESIALDIKTDEGLRIVHRLAERVDIVLACFRAGAAKRAGIDATTLTSLNPDLVYVSAPGYGEDGPYGARPAYAPSIGAAAGLALCDAPGATTATHTLDDIKAAILRLNSGASTNSVQADGIAAPAVASTMLLGLLARRRGHPMGNLTTTMLASATHVLLDANVQYPHRPVTSTPDADLYGYSALYRLYRASDGWVFLAAPTEREWTNLARALAPHGDLTSRAHFESPRLRAQHDADLADTLASIFRTRSKNVWERELAAADVGCVAVTEQSAEKVLQSDEYFDAGYCVTAESPVFGTHRRLCPLVTFSRSATKAEGGCLAGEHTDVVLDELGYGAHDIADLRARDVVR